MTWIWGIDLAESLNYCGILIGLVTNKVQIRGIRKFKNIMYPNIQSLCTGELAKLFPPTKIGVDFSNNQSFAEYLEGHWNPAFLAMGTKHYGNWMFVNPIKFTIQSKLDMKQNSRQMHEANLVEYPDLNQCTPEQQELVKELKEQLLREGATPTTRGLSFLKPEGYDNDLAIAEEIMLQTARPYVTGFTTRATEGPLGVGISIDEMIGESPQDITSRKIKQNLVNSGIDADSVDITYR